MTQYFDTLFINANLATMSQEVATPCGAIKTGALGVKDGRITWVGKGKDLPKYEANTVRDCKHWWLSPGLVDCHTHMVFAGSRAQEFEQRLLGTSYADIAKNGGGIISTVTATRAASEHDLCEDTWSWACVSSASGVTTLEMKSGYGLDLETELKMLRAAKYVEDTGLLRIRKTFLGAHALPPEYAGRADDYIDLVCKEMIPVIAAENLADAVDGFCENIGFSPVQIRRVFEAAKKHGLPVKLHAEQLSNQGGAKLAAEFGALSADHLEHIDEAGVQAMAEAGTVAVILPGAFYTLGETLKPPIDLFRKYKVPMALATDFNPGSSPIISPYVILNQACILFGFTPEEALLAMTLNGAKALGLEHETGSLVVGKSADLVEWPIDSPAELCYWMNGTSLAPNRYYKGKLL